MDRPEDVCAVGEEAAGLSGGGGGGRGAGRGVLVGDVSSRKESQDC